MLSPVRTGAIVRRLLSQLRRDRRTLALVFAAPLLILGLLDLLLRGGSQPPRVDLVVEDPGPAASAAAARLEQSSKLSARRVGRGAAERDLRDGKVDAFVVLPAGFSQEAAAGRPRLEVHVEGSQPGPATEVAGALQQAAPQPAGGRPRLDVSYLHGGPGLDTLDYFGGAFIAMVVFFLVFVTTCVAFLRERSQGTLERLLASPLRRSEIVAGYMVAFTLLALAQSAEVLGFSLLVLRLHNEGGVALIFLVEALLAVAAVNLGIFLSVFARNEFQAVQFIPLVVAPQLLLSGVLFPVASEPGWLQGVSHALPLTYAVEALRSVMIGGADLGAGGLRLDLAVVLGCCLALVLAAAASLRRRVA